MAISEAKRRGNDKYTAKCDRITLKPIQAEGAAVRQAAKTAGQSLQGYILQAVRARMANGTQAEPDDDRIRLSLRADAVQGLERDGETPAQAAARILADAIRQARQDT